VESETHTVDVAGAARAYRLFVPETASGTAPRPLLIAFHGANQGAVNMELMTWMYPVAQSEGVIVAYPEASGDYWNTPNSPPAYWNVPDVPFVDALIEDVASRHAVDRGRVWVTGFSNGAIFAELVACLRGDMVAGLGVVGAGMSADVARSCPWARPIPTVVLFGDADPQFFWDEGFAAAVGMLGGSGTATWLAEHNGCGATPTVSDAAEREVAGDVTEIARWRYTGCANAATVDFYRIVGGGHTWPGSPFNLGAGFGRKSRRIDASRLIVDFMLQHALPGLGG
jgi:polyhydroxybutyrate depolymerase